MISWPKSSEVDSSLLVPEYVSPAAVVLLYTDDRGDDGIFVSDRAGLAFTPGDVAHVTG